jgi:hypothetical protein
MVGYALRAVTALVITACGTGPLSTRASAQVTDTPAGTYAQTCSSASVREGRLYATCRAMNGQRRFTSIELAPCIGSDIGNDDGLLVCHGLRGRIEQPPPYVSPPTYVPPPVLDTDGRAIFGNYTLRSPIYPDPYRIQVYPGGYVAASYQAEGCVGYMNREPDLEITYTAGRAPLIFSVASDDDTTLVINGPDGRWYCDDDGGQYGLNPSLRFVRPQTGVYDVWVGTYEQGRRPTAALHVSETGSQ